MKVKNCMDSFPLEIRVDSVAWQRVRGLKARLKRATAATFQHVPAKLNRAVHGGSFTVLLTTDSALRKLNHDFRGYDKPTDILSFPHFTRRALYRFTTNRERPYIGDIAMAYVATAAQARREGKLLINHATHLMVHGVLHLLGYDHQTPRGATAMRRLERKIMDALDLPDPYAENDRSPYA